MDDHRIRPAEGITQPSKILMMMERVPARPVEQLDVRVGKALPVEPVAKLRWRAELFDFAG